MSAHKVTQTLKEQIDDKFAGDAYATFFEVPNGCGSAQSRTADAIVMSLWPSRGLELIGFEVKASRADWLKELKDPAKAEAICQFCDRWYIVALKGVVKEGELPSTWGLMESSGKGLRIKIQAPELESKPIDRAFLSGLCRSASRLVPSQLEAARSEGFQSGMKRGKEDNASQLKYADEKTKTLEHGIESFQKASGVSISQWSDNTRIGKAVDALMNFQESALNRIRHGIRGAKADLEALEKAKKEIEAISEEEKC